VSARPFAQVIRVGEKHAVVIPSDFQAISGVALFADTPGEYHARMLARQINRLFRMRMHRRCVAE
jgi:hypothetical protein